MHIILFLLMLGACACCAAGAHYAIKKMDWLKYPVLGAGFVLLAFNLASRLMTDRFYFLFPESFGTELLYAGSFLIAGVLSAKYLDTSSRRIIYLVFVIVLSYFTLADHVYFAVAGDRIRHLEGRTSDGVTIQTTGFTCVAASLCTVLGQWGVECSEGEAAYALRTTFRGASVPRVPGAVKKLGVKKKLQAKVISTTWEELQKFDAPCLISTEYFRISHSTALVGLDDKDVVVGEPLAGLLRIERNRYKREWKWDGHAVVVAPDFLHNFHATDKNPRCRELLGMLSRLGYGNDEAGVKKFQADCGFQESGRLDWRTILAVEAQATPAGRASLSAFANPSAGKDDE